MRRTTLALTLISTIFSFLFCGIVVQPVTSQFLGSVYIASDGFVVGTNTIQRNGNIYTLTANISGGIQVQKSNIVIDGAGYTVQGNGAGRGLDLSNGVGEDPSRSIINNVTLKNLRIVDFGFGVETNGGGNHTLCGNYIANCSEACINLGACSYNTITYCTIEGNTISMVYQANYNTVTKNNFLNSGVIVWLSGYETVDSNYWSDYSTKYPSAKEIGNSGIWDTAYVLGGNLTDNHPLINPVSIVYTSNAVYIRNDGSIEPSTAPIQRAGNVYTFTCDIINSSIVIQRDNVVIDGQNFTIHGAYPISGVGISLSARNNVTIRNVAVTNFQTGINLENMTQAQLINNNITTYTYEDGIRLTNSANNVLSNNVIYSYADLYSVPYSRGIAVENGSKNTISENRVTGNCYGVYLRLSNNNTISGNSITKSEFGIDLYSSSDNNLTGNAVFSTVLAISRGVYSDSGTGIWLEVNSTHNQIYKNNIKNNGEAMRIWDYSSNNMIYENNFINNTNQISIITRGIPDPQSIPIPNYWDNGTVGNHWSDYQTKHPNATEIGNSGIGNTPYIIDANNIDHYPLMEPIAIPELPNGAGNDGTGTTEPFPTLLVIAVAVTIVAVVAIGLLVYFKKLKR